MAEIFLACEQGRGGLERLVVIKRVLPHLQENPGFIEMFLREARIMARLSHPNVVQIHELGRDSEGSDFIALEYIQGLTARELMKAAERSGAPMPIEVAVSIVIQACRGLHAAHELCDLQGQPMGLVHRDVSPNNLMITPDGHVKIVDFGIAKPTAGDDIQTYTGSLKGKFSYMSPEQCRNEPLDRRTDIFTMGIVLWELVTGKRLFKRESEMEMLKAVTEGDIPLPSEIQESVPGVFEFVIFKALERDQEGRFATAEEMRLALVEACEIADIDMGEDAIASFSRRFATADLSRHKAELTQALAEGLGGPPESYRRIADSDDLPTIVDRPEVPSESRTDTGSETPPDGPAAHPARPWIVPAGGVALFAFAVLLVAVLGGEPTNTDHDDVPIYDGPAVVLAWPPYVDPEVMAADVAPLADYLARAIERNVVFEVGETYQATADGLIEGRFDFAAMSPLLYVESKERVPGIVLLAVKAFDGAVSYEGWLMERASAPTRTLSELEGARFCFTDEHSTSGYYLPRAFLSSNGYDPDTFVGEVRWSGQHLQALRDLLAGRCDVAATYNGAVYSADDHGIPIGGLRVLEITGVIPQDAVVAGEGVDPELVEAFRAALLAFDPQQHLQIQRVGNVQRITGFEPIDDEAYDLIRPGAE